MSRQPRVAHITTVHQPFDPRIFYKQLRSLREAGFDAHLIAPHDATEQVKGVKIHAISRPPNRSRRLLLQPNVFRKARALDADLYQIHDPELIPVAFVLKVATGSRVLYDMHENYRSKGRVYGRVLRALERWCFGWADHILLAEKSYQSIVAKEEVPHTYIANYVKPINEEDSSGRREEASVSKPLRLLYTGTVSDSRGLRTMVDLAVQIKRNRRPETLEMVGICHHEDQRSWTENRIREEKLGRVLDWKGGETYVHPAEMLPYYRHADVGLALCKPHPNHVESLLTKFYEYLHYGLPIICSNFPLWRRFIERHGCGAVVPPGEPQAVIDILDSWQSHPNKYRQCVENALEAAPEYRWGTMEERLVNLYFELFDHGESNRNDSVPNLGQEADQEQT